MSKSNEETKGALSSKTVWFGILVAFLGFLNEVQGVIKDVPTLSWAVSIIGVAIVILRLITTKGVRL